MSTTYYTSDTHLGHALVARLRGFGDDVEAHDRHIIRIWNDVVSPQDTVIHAGDVFLGGQQNLEKVGLLPGRKILVPGNHDKVHPSNRNWMAHTPRWLEYFSLIAASLNTRIGDIPVHISHFPRAGTYEAHGADRFMPWRPPPGDIVLLHGHTHGGSYVNVTADGALIPNQIHIGWDAFGRPVSENELEMLITSQWTEGEK